MGEPTPDAVVVPWANGTSWDFWQSRNCDRCPLSYDKNYQQWACDLEKSIYLDGMTNGTLPAAIAARLGITNTLTDSFACKERLLLEKGEEKIPVDEMMRRSGEPRLPGF